VEGGSQEMWRGSQMWVWISPNHIKAIWKVLVAENWLFKKLFAFEVRSRQLGFLGGRALLGFRGFRG
jgi:hypothetical protein